MKILNIHKLGGVLPPFSIYIGNKNTQYNLEKSKYANPFYLESWSRKKGLANLFGKDLVCFCSPKPCHGDILRKYIIQSYYELNRGS